MSDSAVMSKEIVACFADAIKTSRDRRDEDGELNEFEMIYSI